MTQRAIGRDGAAWIVMTVAIVLAVLSWAIALEQDRRQAALRFRVAMDGTVDAITARMHEYELALRAASGLLQAAPSVSRDDWRAFVGAMRPAETLPGVQAIGFARIDGRAATPPRTSPAAGDDPADRTAEGPAAAGGAATEPALRAIVELLEPRDPGHPDEVGVDLYQDAVRREAMARARDTAQPALSGPVRWRPDVDGDRRTVLMFLPLYDPPLPRTATREARREALSGYVYSPVRSHDLMRGTLPRETPGLGVAVYDGDTRRAEALIHASAEPGTDPAAPHDATRVLQLPGRQWTLHFAGTSAFDDDARSSQPALVAGVGALMNLSLLLYLRSASRERRRALGEAQRLAAEYEARREAEVALRESERGLREVVEASPAGRLMAAGRDLLGRRRDGSTFPLEIGPSPIAGGATVLAAVVDLSARQAVQDQLAAALREKTVLLDEVHHRVKNNLQVITSLLSLQARGASPEARAALADCRNRVNAMALTHQLLHENGDVTRLHAGEYLQRLARLLAESHRQAAGAIALRVEGADTPLRLELPRAIPCGLLVNELVTNAYKHAFPAARRGTITVGLALDGDTARLTVSDDGVGLAPDFDPVSARSLGFQLVPLLVDQLGATLRRIPASGTAFEVSFPATPEPER
jgi:two-component sensor histidine kinase/CHASE1-domain containing sensor protein